MFRAFFFSRQWWPWSLAGSLFIVAATWYRVEVDVKINEWFGQFYDALQQALAKPGSISLSDYNGQLLTFCEIAALAMVIAVVLDFFTKHFVFRWRQAMNEYYVAHWQKARHIEGASQRVQEDTLRFARLMENLGVSFMRSVLTLLAFMPILWSLSKHVTELPWIGRVDHALIYVAILFALAGTVLLAVVGIRLPGLEYNNQKVEAAYRKELVLGEDDPARATPPTLKELFAKVRQNHFKLYFNYLYFDVVRSSYLQFGVLVPFLALGPALLTGALTLGLLQQIVRAFDRVESSFQYLVNSWGEIVELISVYKRLRGFEAQIKSTS